MLGHFLGLVAGDGLERTLVAFVVPDRGIVAALGSGALGQNDQVEDRPPEEARRLDHAPVGEELLQIGAHGPVAGALGRPQVQKKHTDPSGSNSRMVHRAHALAKIGQTHTLIHQKPLGRRIRGPNPALHAALDRIFRRFRQQDASPHRRDCL
jgi:hypothetical protein